jgi:hypothetical protein
MFPKRRLGLGERLGLQPEIVEADIPRNRSVLRASNLAPGVSLLNRICAAATMRGRSLGMRHPLPLFCGGSGLSIHVLSVKKKGAYHDVLV